MESTIYGAWSVSPDNLSGSGDDGSPGFFAARLDETSFSKELTAADMDLLALSASTDSSPSTDSPYSSSMSTFAPDFSTEVPQTTCPMFNDQILDFPIDDTFSAWPLFPPTPQPPSASSVSPGPYDAYLPDPTLDELLLATMETLDGTSAPAPPTPTPPAPGATFPCPHCDKVFEVRLKLRQHKRHVHLKPACCRLCDKRFGSTRDLGRHVETNHRDAAPALQVESQRSRCPEAGCDYKGRHDNVIRHCRAKHGKDLSKKVKNSG